MIDWWRHLGSILIRPHAGDALRAMQRVGLLTLIFPDFAAIDALVLRDLYHQYTVDEHTFLAIDALISSAIRNPRRRPVCSSSSTRSNGPNSLSSPFSCTTSAKA